MASVLGRITTSDDSPRGPDVKHRIRVRQGWLEAGEAIEFELPRNLACAKCDGGGCDTCGGAGALSVRGRKAPSELVRVVLPATSIEDSETRRAVAIRIPDRGAPAEGELPRGMLILTVVAAEENDEGVRKVHPSLVPPPSEVFEPEPRPDVAIEPEPGAISWPVVVVAAVVVWLLLLALLRAAGAF